MVCVCVCVCVCVFGGEVKDQKEFGINVRKEKVKNSVSNGQPLGICQVGVATVLAYARVTHHGTYVPTEFVWYMTMYTVCFLYKGILYLATKC